MDIRNVGNVGNIDLNGDRTRRTEAQAPYVIPTVAKDDAQISSASRQTAAKVETLAQRARGDETGREAKVALAIEKLQNGELDSAAVLGATAARIADAGFFSV